MRSILLLVSVFVVVAVPSLAVACLWDVDTLKQERQHFPKTLELITGKFLRHSKVFYEWRIRDRLAKLKLEPRNLDYFDDLAVAYDKVGKPKKAIETMLAKNRIRPGMYETEANLGTFYIHSGQLRKGLIHIDNALRVNPEAHFGREQYQKLLVEYVLERRKSVKGLPLCRYLPDSASASSRTFADYLRAKTPDFDDKGRVEALRGIEGMMRFGNHTSPILLEALASLLSDGYREPEQSGRLAARAYLQASHQVTDPDSRLAYRKLAASEMNRYFRYGEIGDELTLEEIEERFRKERRDADVWFEELSENEARWIAEGKNPEREYDRLYYREPEVVNVEGSLLVTVFTLLFFVANLGLFAIVTLELIGYRVVFSSTPSTDTASD